MEIGTVADLNNSAYANFIQGQFQTLFESKASSKKPLLRVSTEGMWDAYLNSFPAGELRQYHNCSCCKRFIDTYGGLVTVNDDGTLTSAVWDHAPMFYRGAWSAMKTLAETGRVQSAFYTSHTSLGFAEHGGWWHVALRLSRSSRSHAQLPAQAIATRAHNLENVRRAILEYPVDLLNRAVVLLEESELYRSATLLGPTRWLRDVATMFRDTKNQRLRDNLLWNEVAQAPDGFCHPRGSMTGLLLDDLAAGKSLDSIRRSFGLKMRGDNYQRPKAAPSEGTIAQAERTFKEMGLERSLARRFALLSEAKTFWVPSEKKSQGAKAEGIFASLRQESKESLENLSPKTVTWAVFQRDVLPKAQRIQFHVSGFTRNFIALVTAVHADAKPIIRWDSEEHRNPVSGYLYVRGSNPEQWGLYSGSMVDVVGISTTPEAWNPDSVQVEKPSIVLFLQGARDSANNSLALFPEILRSELHGVRSVIEAYSNRNKLEVPEGLLASGYLFNDGGYAITLTVTADGFTRNYNIDRLE
jgi:hypothetical protein